MTITTEKDLLQRERELVAESRRLVESAGTSLQLAFARRGYAKAIADLKTAERRISAVSEPVARKAGT